MKLRDVDVALLFAFSCPSPVLSLTHSSILGLIALSLSEEQYIGADLTNLQERLENLQTMARSLQVPYAVIILVEILLPILDPHRTQHLHPQPLQPSHRSSVQLQRRAYRIDLRRREPNVTRRRRLLSDDVSRLVRVFPPRRLGREEKVIEMV